jgi:hypothetical protein
VEGVDAKYDSTNYQKRSEEGEGGQGEKTWADMAEDRPIVCSFFLILSCLRILCLFYGRAESHSTFTRSYPRAERRPSPIKSISVPLLLHQNPVETPNRCRGQYEVDVHSSFRSEFYGAFATFHPC